MNLGLCYWALYSKLLHQPACPKHKANIFHTFTRELQIPDPVSGLAQPDLRDLEIHPTQWKTIHIVSDQEQGIDTTTK